MHLMKTYEQTATYDEYNPGQSIRTVYVPGGYQSFYFNRVPNAGSLNGLGSFSTLPTFAQVGIVGGIAAIVGYAAMAKFGDSTIKPALRKVGINLKGPRVRRLRRSR